MSDAIEPVEAEHRLRIAVLGDFDGVHTRSWLRWFVERGHDVHAISYYPPHSPLDGVTLHVMRSAGLGGNAGIARDAPTRGRSLVERMPRGVIRLIQALRYRRAGLARTVRAIAPDVLHAHFVVEHGFYGLVAGFHPYVVSAWGSDVLVEPQRDPLSRLIAKHVMRKSDLLTSNNAYMAKGMIELGAAESKLHVITLGTDRYFLQARERSVNLRAPDPDRRHVLLSTRAHEPLYNIGDIIDAYGRVVREHPDARLVVAHAGSLTAGLQAKATHSGGRVKFVGTLDRESFREALLDAEMFVSVPSSDGTSVALLQAMAAGCFPIVSDLPTQREWIDDGVNGFLVPVHDPDMLAARISSALGDPELRRKAAEINAGIVAARGLNEVEMAKMEQLYLQIARGPKQSPLTQSPPAR